MKKDKLITRFHQFIRAAVLPQPKLQATLVKNEWLDGTQLELMRLLQKPDLNLENVVVKVYHQQAQDIVHAAMNATVAAHFQGSPLSADAMREKLAPLHALRLLAQTALAENAHRT